MIQKLLPTLVLSTTLLMGCVTEKTRTGPSLNDYVSVVRVADPSHRFPPTASVLLLRNELDLDPRYDRVHLRADLRDGLSKAMANRGYRLVLSGDADYYMCCRILVDNTTQPLDLQNYGDAVRPCGTWFDLGPNPGGYGKGALVIDVYQKDLMIPRWRGLLQAGVLPDLGREQRRDRIDAGIELLLKGFPPRKGRG
jgi:hypothetical protein